MSERTPCCVPFCKRTSRHLYRWWVCGEHWRQTPKKIKARWRRACRAYARGERTWKRYVKLIAIENKLKGAAIEAAGASPL